MLASVSFLLLLLLQTVAAKSYDYGVDTRSILPRQAVSTIVTTGALTSNSNGSLPVRRELRDLEQDNTTWTLYLLALDMMQYTNQTDMESWYQIAGIHGRPFLSWDGAPAAAGNENNGYCSHVSVLFPTWHRPYLALYEQVLSAMAQYIASLYPEPVRDQYVAAAANFRIPYWDWAVAPQAGKHTTPDSVIVSDTVLVDGPVGVQEIHNPLFSYEFKPLDTTQLPDAPFNIWTETKRWPTNNTASAVSRNIQMAMALDQSASSLRNRLFNLFTNYNNYTQFSNEAFTPEGNYDSVESLHDYIHGYTGNGGHMTYIDYSSFDPIFFLHHTMVDRIFALWQVLNPDSWVEPEPSRYGTFTSPAGSIQDSTSPLTPFRSDDNGNFWTSDSSRETSTFGYLYPETIGSNGTDLKVQVATAINNLYGTTAPANLVTRDRFTVRRSRSEMRNRALSIASSEGLPVGLSHDNQYREWIVNIKVKKQALAAPFMVNVFLGPYNPDPTTWMTEPNFVGSHYIFTKASLAMKAMTGCSDCNDEQLISGTVPLTSALLADIKSGDLGSLDAAEVIPYLQAHLRYKVSTLEGGDAGIVESMSVSVVSAEVQKASAGELPKWGSLETELDNVLCG